MRSRGSWGTDHHLYRERKATIDWVRTPLIGGSVGLPRAVISKEELSRQSDVALAISILESDQAKLFSTAHTRCNRPVAAASNIAA